MQEQQRREKAQLKQLQQLEKPEKEQEQKRRAKSAAKELQKEGKRLGKMLSVDAATAPEGESWDTIPDDIEAAPCCASTNDRGCGSAPAST